MAHGTSREELHDAAASRLRAVEQRYTSGRRRLVELLAEAPRPETIPELLDRAPSLAQSSAYRNLVVLEEAGVAHRVVTSDERSRYELAEDLMGHHHHLICTSCGRVDDFTVSSQMERSLDRALTQAIDGTGFSPAGHRLDVLGTCADCDAPSGQDDHARSDPDDHARSDPDADARSGPDSLRHERGG